MGEREWCPLGKGKYASPEPRNSAGFGDHPVSQCTRFAYQVPPALSGEGRRDNMRPYEATIASQASNDMSLTWVGDELCPDATYAMPEQLEWAEH